ncbi:OmpA family protein [Marinivivus vitaminiproducens]|uniref:OmpA family protein n=1 Tax=Marinivivus vitaminiproducens TaxID=3035935 RepID=UPI0027AA7BBB|nr:OmpA family protein [Geminicoccaceae bacterium SCSIO 64248]
MLALPCLAWPWHDARGQASDPEDVQALIERLQGKLDDLSRSGAERDQSLDTLRQQVERATGRLSGERETNDALRQKAGSLESTLGDLSASREALDERMAAQTGQADTLRGQIVGLEAELALTEGERDQAFAESGRLTGMVAGLQDQVAALEKQLDEQRAGQAQAMAERQAQDDERTIQRLEVERLRAEVSGLRREAQERDNALRAVAERASVERLEQERQAGAITALASAFDRSNGIRVEGDRLILPSEGLFEVRSARLTAEGRAAVDRLAQALKAITREWPPERTWLVQVGVHTDRRAQPTPDFRSTWDLSSGQAIAVVQELIGAGLPAERLAAVGFGGFQPVDERDDEIASRRNRRIEVRLSQL